MAERTALEGHRQRLENSICNFHSKVDTMMEGLENDDLSLRPIEEDLPIEGNADEAPNGWQTMAQST